MIFCYVDVVFNEALIMPAKRLFETPDLSGYRWIELYCVNTINITYLDLCYQDDYFRVDSDHF